MKPVADRVTITVSAMGKYVSAQAVSERENWRSWNGCEDGLSDFMDLGKLEP